MTALTTNPVDWILAIACGIPLLIVGICWLVIAAEPRFPCPCDWCEQQRAKDQHPAGRGL